MTRVKKKKKKTENSGHEALGDRTFLQAEDLIKDNLEEW